MATKSYTRVPGDFWTMKMTKQILATGSTDAITLALYLLTCHHCSYLGIYSLPLAYAALDTKMSEEQIAAAMTVLDKVGFAKYDADAEMVWVVESASWTLGKFKEPEAGKKPDNNIKKAQDEYLALENCSLLAAYFKKYGADLMLIARGDEVPFA